MKDKTNNQKKKNQQTKTFVIILHLTKLKIQAISLILNHQQTEDLLEWEINNNNTRRLAFYLGFEWFQ